MEPLFVSCNCSLFKPQLQLRCCKLPASQPGLPASTVRRRQPSCHRPRATDTPFNSAAHHPACFDGPGRLFCALCFSWLPQVSRLTPSRSILAAPLQHLWWWQVNPGRVARQVIAWWPAAYGPLLAPAVPLAPNRRVQRCGWRPRVLHAMVMMQCKVPIIGEGDGIVFCNACDTKQPTRCLGCMTIIEYNDVDNSAWYET